MSTVQADLVALSQSLSLHEAVKGRWQYSLYTIFCGVIANKDSSVFITQWVQVLDFFLKAKDGLMTPMHILHPAGDWPGSEQDFSKYRRMVYLVCETAHPGTRLKNVALINLNKVTEGFTASESNNLISFYA